MPPTSPDLQGSEERYKEAQSDEERLACLVEMLSVLPSTREPKDPG